MAENQTAPGTALALIISIGPNTHPVRLTESQAALMQTLLAALSENEPLRYDKKVKVKFE